MISYDCLLSFLYAKKLNGDDDLLDVAIIELIKNKPINHRFASKYIV